MKRAFVLSIVICLLPVLSHAQLVPGQHSITPVVGTSFPTNDLLHTTVLLTTPPPRSATNPVVADFGVDPGFFGGLRYNYNLTRRLAFEVEATYSVSVFFMQLLELMEDAEPEDEPQFETVTQDARVSQYFLNLSYVASPWTTINPFLTVGIGTHKLDLRQKGDVNLDTVHDLAYMVGFGISVNARERLKFRFELRDYMYNFSFDNQFMDGRSLQIFNELARPDFGKIPAAAAPRFQNDLVLTLGVQVLPF